MFGIAYYHTIITISVVNSIVYNIVNILYKSRTGTESNSEREIYINHYLIL